MKDRFWTPVSYEDAHGTIRKWPGPEGLSEFLLEDRRKNIAADMDPPLVFIMDIPVYRLYFKGGWTWDTPSGWNEPQPEGEPQ